MTISEIIVDWFPLIFGASFLATALTNELRKRGHLKLGREPKKGEIIGLLVLLSFNLLIAFPIIIAGLFIEYTVGAPSILVTIMYVVMALGELIPILVSGVIAYFIIDGIYNKWGISVAATLTTGILFLLIGLDFIGWLQPALPFIAMMVGSFIQFQFTFLIMMIGLSVCLSRCTSNSSESQQKETQSRSKTVTLSSEAALQLIVGLGRRIVIDSDVRVLEALQSIFSINQYAERILTSAGKELDIDIQNVLSKTDMVYAQQIFEVVTGKFGKLGKNIRNAIVLSLMLSLISIVMTVILFNMGIFVGIFLLVPAIMLPVISIFGYQQLSRYEAGRYASPSISQYNSFLLTNIKFKSRVRLERLLFTFIMLLLVTFIGMSILGILASGLIWGSVSFSILLIAALVSSKDRFLTSERLSVKEIIERGLEFIGAVVKDEDLESPTKQLEEQEFIQPIKTDIQSRISEDWQQQLEIRGHSKFAKKVANRDREVYDENVATMIFMGVGGMMVFMGILTNALFTEFSFMQFMHFFSIGLIIIGIPLFLYGTYQYLRTRKITKFEGLNRKYLTTVITHLDLRANGISDLGTFTDSHTPSEYINYGFVMALMPIFTRAAILKLNIRVPWPHDEIEKVWKTRSSYPKLEGLAFVSIAIVFILVYQFFSTDQSNLFPEILELAFLGLIGVIVITALYAIITYYREKHALTKLLPLINTTKDVSNKETFNALVNLIQEQFAMPLRVLLVGNHPKATYTGRSFFTTKGIEFREAVIVPQGMTHNL